LQLSEEEFSNRSTLIAALALTDADFGLKTINYKDELEFAGQAARIRYAIRFVNSSGQKAAFSNTFLIEPTSKIASSPSDLVAKASQESISLRWHAPTTNVDGSSPASILGYNVYRSISAKEPAKLLNQTPVKATEFNDEFFEFEKDYFYFVRAVSLGTGAAPVESAESNIVKFKAVDVFPPSAPGSITLAAAPGVISIFFAVNPEKDVIGYKIYRSEDPDIPKEQWKLLTPELSKTNTYQDLRLPSGKVIYYYITAVDKFGNVSQPSEVVSERVP
jgi:fibronectin type 3 domain-containing protein